MIALLKLLSFKTGNLGFNQSLAPNQRLKLCWPTAGGLKKVIARSAIQIKDAFIITRSVIIYLSRGSE